MAVVDKIVITRGLSMPFFPMRPARGPLIQSTRDVADAWRRVRSAAYVAQPKLNEDRAALAVVDGRVYLQNRYAQWMSQPCNTQRWLKLPDRTVLDGGVYNKQFFPFEALAVLGRSLMGATCEERIVMAYQMSRLCGVPWMFESPTRSWITARTANYPRYEGIVFKERNSPYVLAGSAQQENSSWIKCRWN